MNEMTLSMQATMFALVAEMEAMRVVNTQYVMRGEPPPRNEAEFLAVAAQLHGLASDFRIRAG